LCTFKDKISSVSAILRPELVSNEKEGILRGGILGAERCLGEPTS
jgi:hypothetical protein